MKHIVVDLEMNGVGKEYKNLGCNMETIEIGAIMLDDNFQEISSFRTYVKPEYNTRVTSVVSKLTGINYNMLINAPKFNEALKMFSNWCIGVDDDIKIYAWSTNDYKQVSLSLALDIAGIDFLGREHSALDNARNTAKLFHVFKDREMFDITLSKIAEAMKPTEFGTSLGSLFDFSGFEVA